jgi:hypothetical protein
MHLILEDWSSEEEEQEERKEGKKHDMIRMCKSLSRLVVVVVTTSNKTIGTQDQTLAQIIKNAFGS